MSVSYWNDYYQKSAAPKVRPPSQFAAFMVGEIEESDSVIDIGCGNGRDALFFASQGHHVIGIDAAQSAINSCQETQKALEFGRAEFLCAKIEDDGLADRVEALLGRAVRVTVYARFFIHAITDEQQMHFLDVSRRLCRGGGKLAVEFRTTRDLHQTKVTPDHYRRFLNTLQFIEAARSKKFIPDYVVEGFGFAKFRSDDAHVARCIFRTEE